MERRWTNSFSMSYTLRKNNFPNEISTLTSLCKLTIVIPQVSCLFSKAKVVPSNNRLLNSVTSNPVNLFICVMCIMTSKCFASKLVPWSDGWRRTRWQTLHIMPVIGVLNSNNQYNIYWIKSSCLSVLLHSLSYPKTQPLRLNLPTAFMSTRSQWSQPSSLTWIIPHSRVITVWIICRIEITL